MDFDRYIENERIKNDLQEIDVCFCCERCGAEIYKGNEYYFFERNHLCEDCFDEIQKDEKFEAKRIAGEDDGD